MSETLTGHHRCGILSPLPKCQHRLKIKNMHVIHNYNHNVFLKLIVFSSHYLLAVCKSNTLGGTTNVQNQSMTASTFI